MRTKKEERRKKKEIKKKPLRLKTKNSSVGERRARSGPNILREVLLM